MLRIYYVDMPEAIYNTALYFKNVYRDEWFEDEFAHKIIKSVDRATVLGPRAIDRFALGVIPPTELSGGTNTLLLMYFEPDKVFNASTCGDNCARWILEIAKRQDITINLRRIMDFGGRRFTAEVLNIGEVVHSMKELIIAAINALHGDATGDSASTEKHARGIDAKRLPGGYKMNAGKTAVLSSCGNMTSFTVGNRVIRFRTSDHLVRYEKVTKWDNGYIECLATYDNPPTTEEEYIDLVPILENLYFDPDEFLHGIEKVTVQYA